MTVFQIKKLNGSVSGKKKIAIFVNKFRQEHKFCPSINIMLGSEIALILRKHKKENDNIFF